MPAKKTQPATHSASYAHALRLQAALAEDPGVAVDTPHERPGGVIEPTAAFEFTDAEGREFVVILSRKR
jgi:hypothetical protein